MANDIGPTPFYKRCTSPVAGLMCKSYLSEASADIVYGTDECGDNASAFSKKAMAKHTWSGEVLDGATPGTPEGICVEVVGAEMADLPSFLWENNTATDDGTMIVTKARYEEKEAGYATFSLDAEKSPGV
jgi:hypothetical protein